MDKLRLTVFSFVCTAFAAVFTQVVAQDVVAMAGDEDDSATELVDLGVVERWQADPTTFFDGAEIVLTDLRFIARPLVVFADSPNDPDFIEQVRLIEADLNAMVIRDVILILDTGTANPSELRRQIRPRGFSLVVMDKDGRVNTRKPTPWATREISRQIDTQPLRQQEIRERLGG